MLIGAAAVPREVRAFLREVDRRIQRFRQLHNVPAFIPTDYVRAYQALRALAAAELAAGNLFCEWGSGLGAIACLAAMLDFDAFGIEIEDVLVDAARRLASDFEVPVDFIRGSYIPRDGERELGERYSWLTTGSEDAYGELGLGPEDFNIIFAYPWPDEEGLTAELFERFAGEGALLLTYHSGEEFRVLRKV